MFSGPFNSCRKRRSISEDGNTHRRKRRKLVDTNQHQINTIYNSITDTSMSVLSTAIKLGQNLFSMIRKEIWGQNDELVCDTENYTLNQQESPTNIKNEEATGTFTQTNVNELLDDEDVNNLGYQFSKALQIVTGSNFLRRKKEEEDTILEKTYLHTNTSNFLPRSDIIKKLEEKYLNEETKSITPSTPIDDNDPDYQRAREEVDNYISRLHSSLGSFTVPPKRDPFTNKRDRYSSVEALRRAAAIKKKELIDEIIKIEEEKKKEIERQKEIERHKQRQFKNFKKIEPKKQFVVISSSDEDDEEDDVYSVTSEDKCDSLEEDEIDNSINNNIPIKSPNGLCIITTKQKSDAYRFCQGSDYEIIVDHFNIELKREDLRRLMPGEWLNDEIVNFYMELLNKRCKTNENLPKCHFFNSFFYPLLSKKESGYDYRRVVKWTRSVDIFSIDKILIPIHLGNHWCLAVVEMKNKRLEYYDSLGGCNDFCLKTLRKYLTDEYQDKKKSELDLSEWEDCFMSDVPLQKNGFDCGVFMCKYADFISQDKDLTFDQSDMPYYRIRMVLEIVNKSIDFDK